jgi:hypothetical protein
LIFDRITSSPPTTLSILKSRRKNRAKPESERAKRKGGLGEGIFARSPIPRRGRGQGGKRRRILRQQKGKAENFSSLKEKLKKEGARQKMNGKIFCFARRKAGAAAGRALRPSGRRILLKVGSSGVQQLRPNATLRILREEGRLAPPRRGGAPLANFLIFRD